MPDLHPCADAEFPVVRRLRSLADGEQVRPRHAFRMALRARLVSEARLKAGPAARDRVPC